MKTAGFFDYWDGPGRVAISRGTPRRYPAGYKVFRALAPGHWFNSVDVDTYRTLFFDEILGRLDPQETHEALYKLTDGVEPVLLCYEKPNGRDWCHRAMVSEWFHETIGVEVPEIGQPASAFGISHPLQPALFL